MFRSNSRPSTVRATAVLQAIAVLLSLGTLAHAETAPVRTGHATDFDQYMNEQAVRHKTGRQAGPEVVDSGQGRVRATGHVPSPVDRSHMKGRQPLHLDASRSIQGASTGGGTPTSSTLSVSAVGAPVGYVPPASFDLRPQGDVSSVRDQGVCGDCWAFATYGSMESNQLLAFNANDTFSPNHLNTNHGFAYAACNGGNASMAAAYLTRWSGAQGFEAGPVWESDDPYNPATATPLKQTGLKPRLHVQEVLQLPDRASAGDNTNWKYALQQYGGLYVGFLIDTTTIDTISGKPKYWNTANAAYYYNGGTSTNHAVTLVGWDDNYPASNFATPPAGNGAFLMKNQWGGSWGQNGYFWVSYHDSSLQSATAFAPPEPTSNYTHQFLYDAHGQTTSWSYGSPTGWSANLYTAAAVEPSLQALSFVTPTVDTAYELRVYTRNVGTTPPDATSTSVLPDATLSGTMPFAGYHTLRLAQPLALTGGQPFAVVLKLTVPDTAFPIPAESAVTGYTGAVTSLPGRSYMGANGKSWTDLYAYGDNATIRAYTGLSLSAINAAVQGTPYSQTLSVSDGTGPYSYAVSVGNLPPGLSLASDGMLSGTPLAAGTYSFSISATDSTPASSGGPFQGGQSYSMTVNPSGSSLQQTISFGPAPVLTVGHAGSVVASASSALPVTLGSSTPGICSIAGTTVTGLAAGTCTVTADQAGDATYAAAATATQSIPVNKNNQTLTLSTPAGVAVGGSASASATASSGLSATLSTTTPTICSVSGNTITGLQAGTCTVAANQSGDATWNAAAQVSGNVPVAALKAQTITLTTPTSLTMGTNGSVSATATSGLTVTLASTTPAVCSISGSALIPVGTGSCTVTANQPGDGTTWAATTQVSKTLTVAQKTQTLTVTAPTTLNMGSTATISATASSGLPPVITSTTPTLCTVAGNIVTPVLAGICKISVTQPGDATWKAATAVSKSITVSQLTQTISFTTPASITRPATGSYTATATSGLAVSVSTSTPTICSVDTTSRSITGLKAGTCKLSAAQAGNTVYKAATAVAKSVAIK
ncbi:MAG: hypothetical protein RJA44_1027 [Pseudomonadota bacterium]